MKQLLTLKSPTGQIKEAKHIFSKIKKVDIDYSQENTIVFYIATNGTLIGSEVLFKGGINGCLIDPRTLFRKALINNSDRIILAHNHPNGYLNPSGTDMKTFKDLSKMGTFLQMPILDFIVFNETNYYSVLEN